MWLLVYYTYIAYATTPPTFPRIRSKLEQHEGEQQSASIEISFFINATYSHQAPCASTWPHTNYLRTFSSSRADISFHCPCHPVSLPFIIHNSTSLIGLPLLDSLELTAIWFASALAHTYGYLLIIRLLVHWLSPCLMGKTEGPSFRWSSIVQLYHWISLDILRSWLGLSPVLDTNSPRWNVTFWFHHWISLDILTSWTRAATDDRYRQSF